MTVFRQIVKMTIVFLLKITNFGLNFHYMLVTNAWDEISCWQLWDVIDGLYSRCGRSCFRLWSSCFLIFSEVSRLIWLQRCWWQCLNIGFRCLYSKIDDIGDEFITVTTILKKSPIHFIFNIRHQHWLSRFIQFYHH